MSHIYMLVGASNDSLSGFSLIAPLIQLEALAAIKSMNKPDITQMIIIIILSIICVYCDSIHIRIVSQDHKIS